MSKASITPTPTGQDSKIQCGVIMPISPIDGCLQTHWAEVLEIIKESLEGTIFEAKIVSSSADTTIIHKTIVKNVYDNEIVICDVSARNPNVMLELGMRLAFDKPVVVIKDDVTPYSFDTSPIEHLEYPRDLRFSKIKAFKVELCKKVQATHAAAQGNSSFFLKDYPLFRTATLPEKEVSEMQLVMSEMAELKSAIRSMSSSVSESNRPRTSVLVRLKPEYATAVAEVLRAEGRAADITHSNRGFTFVAVTSLGGESVQNVREHVEMLQNSIEIPF